MDPMSIHGNFRDRPGKIIMDLASIEFTPEDRKKIWDYLENHPGPPGFVGMVPKGIPDPNAPEINPTYHRKFIEYDDEPGVLYPID